MKHNLTRSGFLALALSFSLLAAPQAEAAVVFTNLQLTTTSLSFDISGTMPATGPASRRDLIYFTNPTLFTAPGFALNADFLSAASASFIGTPSSSPVQARLGSPIFGDYGFFRLPAPLALNEPIMGTFTATWSTAQIDPSAVTGLEFYWGGNSVGDDGVLLGTTVPEPSGTALLLCGLATVATRRRRR